MPTNMKIYRIANLAALSFVLSIAFATAAHADDKALPGWNPAVFRDASTIKIMTTEPEVGEHWSTLWVVVIDGQPYVRLDDRAYGRIQKNSTRPYVKLKVADKEFDKVKVEEMPDMKERSAPRWPTSTGWTCSSGTSRIRWSRAWFQRPLRPRRLHIDRAARLLDQVFGIGKGLYDRCGSDSRSSEA